MHAKPLSLPLALVMGVAPGGGAFPCVLDRHDRHQAAHGLERLTGYMDSLEAHAHQLFSPSSTPTPFASTVWAG